MTYRYIPRLLILLGVAGLVVSGYLVTAHYGEQPIECGGVGDCEYVNSSKYASLDGIPVALLGLALYAGLIAAAVYWSSRPGDEKRLLAYWGLALAGAAYAAYLTYVELAILHAICVYCVVSACILAVSLLLSTWAVLDAPASPGDPPPQTAPAKARR